MSEKKALLLRLDVNIVKALEKWAEDEFRSTSAQIEFIIDQALKKAGRLKEAGEKENIPEDTAS